MSVSSLGGSSGSSSASASSNLATNVGPVSFPGLASGLNYSSIITQLTNITAAQEAPLKTKVSNLTGQDTELSTITGLLQTLQGSLSALSNASTFNAFNATSSNSGAINAAQTAGKIVTPGAYTINSASLGTSTQITGANTGHTMNDLINGTASKDVPLASSFAQIAPSNGHSTSGSLTVNGVSVSYDVTTQSLTQILSNIQAQVRAATGDATFTAAYNSGTDKATFSSTAKPVTIGSSGDSGTLAQVLKIDVAQISNTPTSGTVTSAYGIGGINEYQNLSSTNAQGNTVDAGFATSVTAGTFSINGVSINVSPATTALSDIITNINNSSAGVVANFDPESGKLSLANKTSGASSIVIGSSNDTSNFLTAVGISSAAGATTQVGTQSVLNYTDTSGASHIVYTNGNTVSNAIQGLTINITAAVAAGSPVTLNVAQTAKTAETAISTFVTAYNNVITELNSATAAPVVTQKSGTHGLAASAIGGGVLYGNSQVQGIKNQLVSLVSSLQSTGSTAFNSLSNVGLKLDSSFSVLSSSASGNSGKIGTQTYQGTDGQFTALDTSTFETAFSANPNAVASIFTGASNFVNQLGTYLTQVTGTATPVATGLAGHAPVTSTLAAITNQNQNIIQQTNKQLARIMAQVTAQANLLTTEFNASEVQLAQIQQQQSYVSQLSGTSS